MSQPNGESTTTSTEASKVDDKDAGTGNGEATTTQSESEKVYSQKDIDALKKANDKERALREKAEKQIKDAELAKLPEIEQLKTFNTELAAENAKLVKENLQFKVGADLKLPTRFWKKLDGDTEAEMRADAAELLKDIKTDAVVDDIPKGKNDGRKPLTNDGKKQGQSGKADMNTLLRAAMGR